MSTAASAYARHRLGWTRAIPDLGGRDRFDLAEGLYPPPASIARVLRHFPTTAIAMLPDREALDLRRALATYLDVTPANVIVSSGADEVIDLIPRTYLDQGDAAVVVVPTFERLVRTNEKVGAAVKLFRLPERQSFTFVAGDVERLCGTIERASARVLWLCSPNNPTGVVVDLRTIATIARQSPTTVVVVDEAYQEYASLDPRQSAVSLIARYPNVIVLRTFSKALSLAGARIGYAVASEEACAALRTLQIAFSTSAIAQSLALATLQDLDATRRLATYVHEERARLESTLRGNANLSFIGGSRTNFVFARHRSRDLAADLREHDIRVLEWRGSPGVERVPYARISISTQAANVRLRTALATLA